MDYLNDAVGKQAGLYSSIIRMKRIFLALNKIFCCLPL